MKTSFKCLPYGNLPYDSNEAATKMMVKLFESVPFLAMIPLQSSKDNLIFRTLENIPGVRFKDKRVYLKEKLSSFKQGLVALDVAFNTPSTENLEAYKFESSFLERYLQILKRVKPKETVVNLLGPLTVSQILINSDKSQLLIDKCYRKLITQSICVKSLWIIEKIKEASPSTHPIIVLEEPMLNTFSEIKRQNEDLTRDILVNMYSKIIEKIRENKASVAIQCFEKCDWTIPIEAGADIISFNAYDNPNNLNIIPEQVNNFLAKGGRINWAIVPTKNESIVKALNIDMVYNRLINAIEGLIIAGVSEKLAYNNATVSIQGNPDKLPIIFAEKAMILATHLAKRIPVKS